METIHPTPNAEQQAKATTIDTIPTQTEQNQLPETVSESAPAQELTHESLIEKMKQILADDNAEITADTIAQLRQQHHALTRRSKSVTEESDELTDNVQDPVETSESQNGCEFTTLLERLKEKKAARRARIEAEQALSLQRKQEIVARLAEMAQDADNVNLHFQEAKELQAEFKASGEVAQEHATAIWKAFQEIVERYYDQLKVNKELRDYDFKKNLAEKQLIIAEAQSLKSDNDVLTAFHRLQELHDKWRAIGPVARELREEIWMAFKDASAEVNKRYQAYYEQRKAIEAEAEAAKTALCEQIEAIDLTSLKGFGAWNRATNEIKEMQGKWKELGVAPRRTHNALYNRFRTAADAFFAAKAAFFNDTKDQLQSNLEAKTLLCEEAESLAKSDQWRQTAERLTELQKQWRTIGAVPKKVSDELWNRFLGACNEFFDRKKKASASQRTTEQANLKTKKSILAQLRELLKDTEIDVAQATTLIQQLRTQWQATGHVPYRDKAKLAEAYRQTVGDLFEKYDLNHGRARMEAFTESVNEMSGDDQRMMRERDRLMRALEGKRSDLATYENNMRFLSSSSKTGNSLVTDMHRNMQRIKDAISEIESKIKVIDSHMA